MLGVALDFERAMVQDIGPIGYLEREMHVLLDQQNTCTGFIGNAAQHRQQALDDDGRETKAHLVDHQQLGARRKRAAHGQHLLFATRQQACLAIHELVERREIPERLVEVGRALRCPQLEVLANGELKEQAAIFRDMRQALASNHVGAATLHGFAEHANVARQHRVERRGGQQRCGLAGTVGSEQRNDLAFVDREVQIAYNRDTVVTGGKIVDLEQSHQCVSSSAE